MSSRITRPARFTERRLALALWASQSLVLPAALIAQDAAETSKSTPIYVEQSSAWNARFDHETGATGRLLLPEITGGGVALFDYDRDGDLDIYAVQSGSLDGGIGAGSSDRLLRNELAERDGARTVRFVDATKESGLMEQPEGPQPYGQGVAVGDVDGDGWQDIYVTHVGANKLWRNRAGTFERVSSGAEDDRWSTSATFFDADGDGDLDLFVANYLVWSLKSVVSCHATNSRRDYCGPQSYPPAGDSFFVNAGNGTFQPAPHTTFPSTPGAGLGVVTLDANEDGRFEVLVANDGMANHLWELQGQRFQDTGLLAGVAVNAEGLPEASMGIAVGDIDGNGEFDLFFTHLDGETDTLLLSQGHALFEDRTTAARLGPVTLRRTSFGTASVDIDLDGRLDLAIVSGAVRLGNESGADGTEGLGQPNLLLRNVMPVDANNNLPSFKPWPATAAPAMAESRVSRGLAAGDLDNDGDQDLVVINSNDRMQVLENQTNPTSWFGLSLERFTEFGPPLLSWRAQLVRSGAFLAIREVRTDGSYLSASDPRIVFANVRVGDEIWLFPPGQARAEPTPHRLSVTAAHLEQYNSWVLPE